MVALDTFLMTKTKKQAEKQKNSDDPSASYGQQSANESEMRCKFPSITIGPELKGLHSSKRSATETKKRKKRQANRQPQVSAQKIARISQYESVLAGMRARPSKYCLPFDTHHLCIDKQEAAAAIDLQKIIRDRQYLRCTVRRFGIRHQRNLSRTGVRQQLGYIKAYLETGRVPRYFQEQFEELLAKKLTDEAFFMRTQLLQ